MANGPCASNCCDLVVYETRSGDELWCEPGTRCDCFEARFADQLLRDYPPDLHDAMIELNAVMEHLPHEKDGKRLAFVRTRDGLLLAWVNHPERVTDEGRIREALGLQPVTSLT